MRFELSLLLALMAGEAIDSRAAPRRALLAGGPLALAWRTGVIAPIWLVAVSLTGRPLFAAVATAVTVAIVVAISNLKRALLREPLVFSDFALLEHVIGHPRLFYIEQRWIWTASAAGAVLIAAIALWMLFEPRAASGAMQVAALTAAAALAIAPLVLPCRGWLAASAARLVAAPDPQADVGRIGLLVSLAASFVLWRAAAASKPAGPQATPFASPQPYRAVVVIQAEAFVDLRRLGYRDVRLTAFDRLKARAFSAGLLEVPCQGGYTLRPESAVLTGIGFEAQGFDGFHPYLRPQRLNAAALPRLLAEAGWDTLFVHPYDRSFFRRDRAMPQLGFARFADESEFAGARRVGPYIGDGAVADFVVAAIRQRPPGAPPVFIFAATMEAHEPYGPGRLPGEDDPIRQYVHHIENADRMLERIADALDAGDGRALLLFFGDHVPLLPSFADPFADTRTDYLAVELGPGARNTPTDPATTRPDHLHALIRTRFSG